MLKERSIIYMKWIYLAALLIAVFSGFGNMPMYGRYYVADIPGFGWSANFFINLHIHYLSGALLLAASTYFIFLYLRRRNRGARLSTTGIIRVSLLGLVLVSGVLAAIKNLPNVNLPQAGLMALAFVHLGAVMGFIFFSLVCRFLKIPWMADALRHRTIYPA